MATTMPQPGTGAEEHREDAQIEDAVAPELVPVPDTVDTEIPVETALSDDAIPAPADAERKSWFDYVKSPWAIGAATLAAAGVLYLGTRSNDSSEAAPASPPAVAADQNPGTDTGSGEASEQVITPTESEDSEAEQDVETPEIIAEIDGIFIDGKESQLRSIFEGIDWSTRESILATAPEPMYVTPDEDGKINAQDAVDARTYNASIWNATNDPRYGAAMIGITDTSEINDSRYYLELLGGDTYAEVISWGVASTLSQSEDGTVLIGGTGVEYVKTPGVVNVKIADFDMMVLTPEADESVAAVSFDFNDDKHFMRSNFFEDTAYSIAGHGEIEMPWTGYTGPAF